VTDLGKRDESELGDEVGLRFERIDVEPALVARWAIGLGAVSVVFAALAVWMLVFLRHREEKQDPQRPALFFSDETRQPEGVRLQATPFGDLHALREQEHRILTTYGWVDQPSGVVHIPIEEAMRLYLSRQGAAAGTAAAVPAGRVPTDSAPVPSPMAPVESATPLPPPPASPVPSDRPAPPPPHGAASPGARQ